MRILFAGPSLYGTTPDLTGIVLRGPAMQGDIARAVLEGATAIGLIDGYFDAVAAPWHKEILFALASGIAMLGSSSMGALRAAECAPFGMRPIGAIAEAYCSGILDDDAAVALSHGPAELGYPPLTEPLVEVQPTLERLRQLGLLSNGELGQLWDEANRLYFKDRTDEAIFAMLPGKLGAYREHRVSRKAEDALLLIAELKTCPAIRVPRPDIPQPPSLFTRRVLPELVEAR
jgi:hypothetical protein